MTRGSLVAVALVGAWIGAGERPAAGDDWPQWRGPDRTGLSRESSLLTGWGSSGPSVVWSAGNLGNGYGSVAVSGGVVAVQGMRAGQSILSVLNREDGKGIWSKAIGPALDNDRGPGPRSTPTIDGDRVYVLTENGDLACLLVKDATILWRRNILTEFGARNTPWLISESPLVDGERVFVTPGGRGAGMVALDKMTGRTVWTSTELSDEPGYASPVVADVQGIRTVMTLTSEAGIGVRASDGKLMWRYRPVANSTANAATPIFFDDKVFYSSDYGTGGALLGLRAEAGSIRAEEIYFTRDMQNHHGGIVLVNGYLYGFNNSILTCLEFASGKMMWRHRSVGKGAIAYADSRLYILGEDNIVGLVEATPAGYREHGRFSIRDERWPAWAHPVVSGGRLYIRNQTTLTSYDVRAR